MPVLPALRVTMNNAGAQQSGKNNNRKEEFICFHEPKINTAIVIYGSFFCHFKVIKTQKRKG